MADSLQRLREEMHTATNGRLDANSSISRAMQRFSADPKILAVQKLMPGSLLNYRLRGTTLPHEESLIPLVNVIKDKVTTHSVWKVENIDTSAPMEIGMTAGTDGEEAFEEGYGKASELAVQAVHRGTGAKGGRNGGKGSQLERTGVLQQRKG